MKKDGMGRRKEQAAETKQKLYASAEQLFRKHNFDDVSIDAIVEHAGVSKGTFYVHFDSKDAIIACLISDYVSKVDLDYQSYLDSFPADASASTILLSLIGKIADVLMDMIGYENMMTVYKVQLTKTVDTETVMGYNRRLYQIFGNVIERGIRQGEFKADLPVEILTRHFVMAIRGLTYDWCIRYPDFDLREESLKHFQLLLSGIQSR